jgi:hypothetical protein
MLIALLSIRPKGQFHHNKNLNDLKGLCYYITLDVSSFGIFPSMCVCD